MARHEANELGATPMNPLSHPPSSSYGGTGRMGAGRPEPRFFLPWPPATVRLKRAKSCQANVCRRFVCCWKAYRYALARFEACRAKVGNLEAKIGSADSSGWLRMAPKCLKVSENEVVRLLRFDGYCLR